jgi:hypothetical protein
LNPAFRVRGSTSYDRRWAVLVYAASDRMSLLAVRYSVRDTAKS